MRLIIILTAILSLIGSLGAATRSSANYSMTTETLSDGGGRATSANYTIDASVHGGAAAGLSQVATYKDKAGYIGQLYDLQSLNVTALPSPVNEDATSQLSATGVNDDATTLALTATQVGWSVLSGPISNITLGGLATPAAVYQNTQANLQGTYQGVNGTTFLTVTDNLPDNYGTYAGDGLPDGWQVQNFGVGSPDAGPNADPDGDSQKNLSEWLTGYNPTDALSRFSLIITLNGLNNNKLTLSKVIPSRFYTLQANTDLGTTWSNIGTRSSVGSEQTDYNMFDTSFVEPRKFYRIMVEDQ